MSVEYDQKEAKLRRVGLWTRFGSHRYSRTCRHATNQGCQTIQSNCTVAAQHDADPCTPLLCPGAPASRTSCMLPARTIRFPVEPAKYTMSRVHDKILEATEDECRTIIYVSEELSAAPNNSSDSHAKHYISLPWWLVENKRSKGFGYRRRSALPPTNLNIGSSVEQEGLSQHLVVLRCGRKVFGVEHPVLASSTRG